MDQIDSAPPIAGLCEMVAQARQRAAEDPFGNPTLSVALTLSRWMDRGELDLDGIAALVQLLRDRAFERRAGRLAAYAGGADPAANAAALDRLAASLARPDADDSPVPFVAYRGLCERTRFAAEMDEKHRVYGERYPVDEDFLAALAHMPPASGIALGFDRLVMLATGAPRIDDVMWTPVP